MDLIFNILKNWIIPKIIIEKILISISNTIQEKITINAS